MTKSDFLHKLVQEKKLEAVEPSCEIALSYLQKSADSLRSAQVLLQNNLYENSIALAYYSMYDALTAILFRVGIKCENHSGSILLLKDLFDEKELYEIITLAKKERIDKQYYVKSVSNLALTASLANQTYKEAENFTVQLRLKIQNLQQVQISLLQKKFLRLVK